MMKKENEIIGEKIQMTKTQPSKKQLYTFTKYGIQIEAENQDEAKKKLEKILKEKS